MLQDLFLLLLALLGFLGLVCVGGLVAWLLGYDLNEPEYYEQKERNNGKRI